MKLGSLKEIRTPKGVIGQLQFGKKFSGAWGEFLCHPTHSKSHWICVNFRQVALAWALGYWPQYRHPARTGCNVKLLTVYKSQKHQIRTHHKPINIGQLMLRSIQVVISCSRDHVILVITSSRPANGTHFNADRQFRQTWRHTNSSSPVLITSSRHEWNAFSPVVNSWTRVHDLKGTQHQVALWKYWMIIEKLIDGINSSADDRVTESSSTEPIRTSPRLALSPSWGRCRRSKAWLAGRAL